MGTTCANAGFARIVRGYDYVVAYAVNNEKFGELVETALMGLPEPFASFVEEVPVEIRDRPTGKEIRRLGLARDHLLLGLYQGRPRPERSVEDSGRVPDVILIFQKNIEAVCNSERDLIEQVRITVLHEIGHHFGMDENELDRLGYG